ncbi:hypothetical protein L2E82_48577 [Cichorium intybus]|uniref:Uncharacterized protein n=1 Tax=Cichorium intybus TaxID=13427 RepID=A0ACB8YYN9_CICIN|nr:hypothetical protein L2E82_48577 [Cichorium intybus]
MHSNSKRCVDTTWHGLGRGRNDDYVQLLGVRNFKLTTCRSLNLIPLRIFNATFDYIANSNSNLEWRSTIE